MKRIHRVLVAIGLCLHLFGCGGGGGGGDSSQTVPPVTPTTPTAPDPAVLAQKAGLSALFEERVVSHHSRALRIDLQWTDVFTDEIGYRVEQLKEDGQWTEVRREAPKEGAGTTMKSQSLYWGTLRVVAELPGRTVVLRTVEQKELLVPPEIPNGRPGLRDDLYKTTVSGIANLGIVPGGTASMSSRLELNGQALSLGNAGESVAWDTRTLPEKRYPYQLTRQYSADWTYVESGWIAVANQNPSAEVTFRIEGDLAGAGLWILRWENAVSTRPALFVDGVQVADPLVRSCGSDDAACHMAGVVGLYGMYVRIQDYSPGEHQLMLRFDTKDGGRREYSGTLRFDHPPQLTLSVDPDGQPVAQEVRVKGRLSDDGGAATMQVLLDETLRYEVKQGDFDLPFDSAGLSAGEHRLTLLARDDVGHETRRDLLLLKLESGQVAQLMGAQARMLDASSESVLADVERWPAKEPRLEWLRAGVAVESLPVPGVEWFWLWSWRVTDEGFLGVPDEPINSPRPWYRWDRQLVRTDLSLVAGKIAGRPIADGLWVASVEGDTAAGAARVHILNQATGQHFAFSPGADGSSANSEARIAEGGLAALPGSARLVWTTQDKLMLSDTATGRSEVLERGSVVLPVTDGKQVAWQRGADDAAELMLRPASTGAASVRIAPQPDQRLGTFALHGGLLVWTETGPVSGDKVTKLYALRDGKPEVISQPIFDVIGFDLIGTAGQRVVYRGRDGRLKLWTAARGNRVVFPSGNALLRGGSLMVEYISGLSLGAYIYRIPLDALD